MKKTVYILIIILIASGCSSFRKAPKKVFSSYPQPELPDYSKAYAWSCLPEKKDYADLIPEGSTPEAQASAVADVFFIHPTTFGGGLAWNADLLDAELNAKTDERAIKNQSSVFNSSCRVYVPRYRQMVFGGYVTEDTASKRLALELAYKDVKAAFAYYIEHFNEGRPFVIAGHSQGSFHGIRLVKELIDGKPIQNRMVAAYLAGWPFPASTFTSIPVCDTPDQTGCVLGWASWKKGFEPKSINGYYKDAVVVNPITWKTDGQMAADSLHQGFLGGKFKKLKPQFADAQAHKGILWVSNPIPLAGFIKNYDVGDYNLFWLDIRKNVEHRVQAFNQMGE